MFSVRVKVHVTLTSIRNNKRSVTPPSCCIDYVHFQSVCFWFIQKAFSFPAPAYCCVCSCRRFYDVAILVASFFMGTELANAVDVSNIKVGEWHVHSLTRHCFDNPRINGRATPSLVRHHTRHISLLRQQFQLVSIARAIWFLTNGNCNERERKTHTGVY